MERIEDSERFLELQEYVAIKYSEIQEQADKDEELKTLYKEYEFFESSEVVNKAIKYFMHDRYRNIILPIVKSLDFMQTNADDLHNVQIALNSYMSFIRILECDFVLYKNIDEELIENKLLDFAYNKSKEILEKEEMTEEDKGKLMAYNFLSDLVQQYLTHEEREYDE